MGILGLFIWPLCVKGQRLIFVKEYGHYWLRQVWDKANAKKFNPWSLAHKGQMNKPQNTLLKMEDLNWDLL